jgi:hypothetical protein
VLADTLKEVKIVIRMEYEQRMIVRFLLKERFDALQIAEELKT